LAAGNAAASVLKRNRDATSTQADSLALPPLQGFARLHSLASDNIGGASDLQLPVKFRLAMCPSVQHQVTPGEEDAVTAEQELLIRQSLRHIWAQSAGAFSFPLGASHSSYSHLNRSSSITSFSLSTPSFRADSQQIEVDVSLLQPMVLQVYISFAGCHSSAHIASHGFRSFAIPLRACAARWGSLWMSRTPKATFNQCAALQVDTHKHYPPPPSPTTELVLLDLALMKTASQPQMKSIYSRILAQRDAYAQEACAQVLLDLAFPPLTLNTVPLLHKHAAKR
jgi:hypothetical protein